MTAHSAPSLDPTHRPLRAPDVTRFVRAALPRFTDGRRVTVVGFYDRELPEALWQGISAVPDLTLIAYDLREGDPTDHLEKLLSAPDAGHFSFHDFCQVLSRPTSRFAKGYAKSRTATGDEPGAGADYTSYEFPRRDLESWQVETVLAGHFAGDPAEQRRSADRFFSLLSRGDGADYTVEVLSGPASERRRLTVTGKSPWMELCGPSVVGDVRFAPGCELFWNGAEVDGDFHCTGALNLLPLGNEFDDAPYRRLLELGALLPDEAVDLRLKAGRLTGIDSPGPLAAAFAEVFASDVAYSHVVEVGIGLSPAALPLITSWASPTNEAVSGVHVGLGADPAHIDRFATRIHLDFVAPDVTVLVNGELFYDQGRFTADTTAAVAA
ncbi:hypothetical protein ACIRF8_33365 [Streptomyces sp. NPDC102406]|uniref:hypothetical protein n=1 Tax=Streptomyces sp. NPDC102406 TaxID=3366171 RepID=UPI003821AA5F